MDGVEAVIPEAAHQRIDILTRYQREQDLLIVSVKPHVSRSEEHTSELQSQSNLVCRLLLEKKKKTHNSTLLLRPSLLLTSTTQYQDVAPPLRRFYSSYAEISRASLSLPSAGSCLTSH